jgi:8-oxo-dGTP pyrophosphatase MutT (NUDIX family)
MNDPLGATPGHEAHEEPAWAVDVEKPTPWTAGPGRLLYDTRWIKLIEYDAVAPTGRTTTYGVVRFQNLAAGVVPLHEDGTVTLVGQQRFALRNYEWEIPEGGVPFDEDPLVGAKRELREEVGLEAKEWREILRLQLSNSITDERAVCFLARDFTPVPIDPDETEILDIVRVPFRDLLAEIAAGRIQDVMTVAATLRVHHMAASGELPDDLARLVLG